jgi:hypothetical protein
MDLTLEKPPKSIKVRDADLEAPLASSDSDESSSSESSSSSEESADSDSGSSSTEKQNKKGKLDEFYEKVQNFNKKGNTQNDKFQGRKRRRTSDSNTERKEK